MIFPNTKHLFGEPAAAAEQLPDRWFISPEPLFWWATAYGDRSAARTILIRYFAIHPGGRKGFDDGRELAAAGEGPPVPISKAMIAFGWSAVSTGALGAEEII